jgi:HPt (histidine-containing phosphotransfer) domain-containing protein
VPEEPASRSALDGEAIARLLRLGGDELAGRMAALFLGLAPERLREARAAVAAGDRDQVRRAAHSLKSSSGNVGAYAVLEAAGQLEEAAERGEPPAELTALLAALEAALEGADPELRALAARTESQA